MASPRLKVFSWSDGFHAFTVAAPSRPKALAAWGIERDIFKDGLARQITAGPDHDAALDRPGEVVQRGLSVDIGDVKPRKVASQSSPKAASKSARDKAARLQAELDTLDIEHDAALNALAAEREALDARIDDAVASHNRARRRLMRDLKAARARL